MKRDAKVISSNLYEKGGKIYCKQKCIIEFPKWYADKDLLNMAELSHVFGVFAIIIGETYSVSVIPTILTTNPLIVKEVVKDGVEYTQFHYGKDDPILENTKAVKKEMVSYSLFESFFMYSKVPWYIEYDDLVRLLDNLAKHAGSKLGNNLIANEVLVGFVTRNAKDKKVYHRQVIKDPYVYIDLMNVYYAVSTVTNKLAGNYFQNAIVSAIAQKEKTTTKLEQHAWR
ncbi:hypothetical protein AGENTSMITH_122 [Bacillus phage vB_BspM_AgentSmith]|nr:hypothetical protein AGENTSMITH_122 [Bacillus phage vB_BspM_AgentSmith]